MKNNITSVKNWIVASIFLSVGFVLHFFSERTVRRCGRLFGKILQKLSSKRAAITFQNILLAFPDKSEAECKNICNESYATLGITLAEMLVLPYSTDEQLRTTIRCKNVELIAEQAAKGKGVILLSGHFGNWEYLALFVRLYLDIPITVVVKRQSNPILDTYLTNYRSRTGNTLVEMKSAAKGTLQAIRSGEAVALLADQSAVHDKHIMVPFFGREAATFISPAVLAVKMGTPIITGYAIRDDEKGGYNVELKTLDWQNHDVVSISSDEPDDIVRCTFAHVAELEAIIRRYPHLWAWQHRRWK